MSDGRPDIERNRYNIAGVQVANPTQKGDLSVGSASVDPTGRTISDQLNLPVDAQGALQDGYVLTSDSSDSTFGLKWSAPVAQVNDTPNKVAGFASPSGEIEAKENLTHSSNGLTIGAQTNHAKTALSLESQTGITDFTRITLQSNTAGDSDEAEHTLDINNGNVNQKRHDRLVFNGRIGLQAQTAHGRYSNASVVNLAIQAHHQMNELTFPSQYALAQLATNNSTTSATALAKMVVLPANNLAQINALPSLLKAEHTTVEASLNADGKSLSTMHGQPSLDMLADNGIAYCMEDDSYYVYSQVQDTFLKLTTASDVSAIGAMTVKESSAETVLLTGGNSSDVEYTSMFSFGQVLKIEAIGSSTMSGNVNVRLEFYKSINMTNADFTGQAEIIVEPSSTTFAYPSVTVEDSTGQGKIYVKIQNVSTNTTLDATIKIKGAGI